MSMNIDFSSNPGFSLYIILLAISGVLMVGIGATAFSRLSTGWRIFNLIAGVAFFGYAFYLAFLFQGGTYIIFFKAFILPALMVINAIRSAVTRRKTRAPQQNGWAGPQQTAWAVPQQAGGPGPQQNGWTAPEQQGWAAAPQPGQPGQPSPQQATWPGPQQAGGPGPQPPGWAAPQQPGWSAPPQPGQAGPQ
jgi:hypothetical protein